MKFSININFVYLSSVILFLFLNYSFRSKPNLGEISLIEKSTNLLNNNEIINLENLDSPNNRISLGKNFLIHDNKNWYKVLQISLWKKKYLNLYFVNKYLRINDFEVQNLNNNNFALGTYQNENIVYACMKDSKNFLFDVSYKKIIKSSDLVFWGRTFINNIIQLIYSFTPRNYECLLVITSDTKFFQSSEKKINKIIFNKFLYE